MNLAVHGCRSVIHDFTLQSIVFISRPILRSPYHQDSEIVQFKRLGDEIGSAFLPGFERLVAGPSSLTNRDNGSNPASIMFAEHRPQSSNRRPITNAARDCSNKTCKLQAGRTARLLNPDALTPDLAAPILDNRQQTRRYEFPPPTARPYIRRRISIVIRLG